MRTVGLFEAKTRFSELCRHVAKTGEEILVTNRGQPITRICPPKPRPPHKNHGILHDLKMDEKKHGLLPAQGDDFPEVWLHRSPSRSTPPIP